MTGVKSKIAVFGGSFNPPGIHHRQIAERLSAMFDRVFIVPCGPRPDKPVTNNIEPLHRATMVDLTFQGLAKVEVQLFDLESSSFTRTWELNEMYSQFGEVWHVIGADLYLGGAKGESEIQKYWYRGKELWSQARFVVLTRPGFAIDHKDLPPNHILLENESHGSSSQIRARIFSHKSVDVFTTTKVSDYIERHNLYLGVRSIGTSSIAPNEIRPEIIADSDDSEIARICRDFDTEPEDPNLLVVVGGDGAMLRAIRTHWRRRIPFYGINAGHLGFLLNQNDDRPRPGAELHLYQIPLLWVQCELQSSESTSDLAFNDAWIERKTGQSAWIEIRVNGQVRVPQLVADGSLVATAAGSASYARAMGAPPVPFDTPVLILAGSNVLRPISWRSAVLPIDSTVEFRSLDPKKRPLQGFVDGVPKGDTKSMRIRVSRTAAVELAFEADFDAAEKLARLQFP